MQRSRLKNIANRSGKQADKLRYKKQRNLAVRLNRKAKFKYFNNLSSDPSNKMFWKSCKPYFTNKGSTSSNNIMLKENDNIVREGKDITFTFNEFFGSIVL